MRYQPDVAIVLAERLDRGLVVEQRELVARGGGHDFLALMVVAIATIAPTRNTTNLF